MYVCSNENNIQRIHLLDHYLPKRSQCGQFYASIGKHSDPNIANIVIFNELREEAIIELVVVNLPLQTYSLVRRTPTPTHREKTLTCLKTLLRELFVVSL